MITLTVRHSGSLSLDLKRLRRGWVRLRAWFAAEPRYIRKLRYVATVEVTRGVDELGHVHFHVVTWLPYVDFAALGVEWNRATAGAGAAQPEITTPTGNNASAAALYIAKYASKGADPDDLGRDLAGQWYCASYGRRLVTASEGFWVPWKRCPECDDLEPPWAILSVQYPDDVVCWVGPAVPAAVWDELRPRPPPEVAQVGLDEVEMSLERLIKGKVWVRDGRRLRWRPVTEPPDAPLRDL